MGRRIKFPHKAFIDNFCQNPLNPLKRYDFLLSIPAQYDRWLVEKLIEDMDACYRRNDHVGTIRASYEALTHLLGNELIIPKTLKDEDTLKLEMIAHALIKWDKASAWLGNKAHLTTYQIAKDLRCIYESLRDYRRAISIASTFIYSLQSMGDIRVWNYIDIDRKANSPDAERAILGSEASLFSKMVWWNKARTYYYKCKDIDEKIGTSKASEGQLIAELGFVEAHLPGYFREGEKKMEDGLKICREAGHIGFELQIQRDRIEYYFQRKERDAALHIAGGAVELLKQHPNSFGGLRKRIFRLLEFIENSSRDKRRKTLKNIIAYRPLHELIEAANKELNDGRKYATMTLLIEALELCTLLICLKNIRKLQEGQGIYDKNTEDKIENFIRSLKEKRKLEAPLLPTKNNWLYNAQIYDEETRDKINELLIIRNKIFHGNVESWWIKFYGQLDKVLANFDWLCSFINAQGLLDYEPDEGEIKL